MKQIDTKLFRAITQTIKYGVVIGDIGLTLHCLLLLFGINTPILNFLFGISTLGFIIIFLSSYLLGFCDLFRAFLTHGFCVKCCIVYEEWVGFGVLLIPFRLFMLLSGIILFCLLIKRRVKFFSSDS